MKKLFLYSIKAYQRISHMLFPRSCRFYPRCSQYALEAIDQHGVIKGISMALWRILRCSPLSKGGWDPVK